MAKFKIGDRVVKKKHSFWGEVIPVGSKGTVSEDNNNHPWVDWDTGLTRPCEEDNMELEEKTMDNLEVGDLLVKDNISYKKKVLAVFENSDGVKCVATEDTDDHAVGGAKVTTLVSMGWGLKPSEPEVKEVTLEEVAKKFGVDTSNIRIKE